MRCTAGDNLAIHVGVATAPAGSALVVDVGEVAERGYWGEVLTTGALARGLAGLVIDGGVRDVAALAATWPSPRSRARSPSVARPSVSGGRPASPPRSAGVRVAPGDWVVADADGVVIVPGEALDEVLAAGRARAAAEDGYFASLRGGATTVDLLGLDGSLIERPEGSAAG